MFNNIFDQKKIIVHKESTKGNSVDNSYLLQVMEEYLLKRFALFNQGAAKSILIIGKHSKNITNNILSHHEIKYYDPLLNKQFYKDYKFPFSIESFDIVLENFIFHWLNNPLEYLLNIKSILRNSGLYINGFLGGQTLFELREIMLKTDLEFFSGTNARISPMIKPDSYAKLLQKTGFKNTIVEHEITIAEYKHITELIKYLRFIGENNSLKEITPISHKEYITKANNNYHKLYSYEKKIKATFNLILSVAWK